MATIHAEPVGGGGVSFPLTPDTDQTEEVGTDSLRFIGMHARLGVFVGSSTALGAVGTGGTRSFGANPTGLMAGGQVETSTGTASHYLRGGADKAVACVGNVKSTSTGDATLNNNGEGCSIFGAAIATAAGNALVEAASTGVGNFTSAMIQASTSNQTFSNGAYGSFLSGYSGAAGVSNVTLTSAAAGAFCSLVSLPILSIATAGATVSGSGSFTQGSMLAVTGTHTWIVSGAGAFAQGFSNGGTLTSSNSGSFAQGAAVAAAIVASGLGSMARGHANSGNAITASGAGSLALGDSASGAITASATNAFQLGVGVNATANSLQVGVSGTGPKISANGDGFFGGDVEIDGALNHDGTTIGFHGTAPVTQADISGSTAGNAALQNLISALVARGDFTDSTT